MHLGKKIVIIISIKRYMEKDRLDFVNENIGKLFRSIFFPTLIGMAFNSALNICDGMFVGHGVGSNALAAINIVAPLFLICAGLGLMFGIGASVIGGIRLAEGNVTAARIIMTQAYIAGAVIFGHGGYFPQRNRQRGL